MLINLSNHPSLEWSDFQKNTAIDLYQSIVDMDFPIVSPNSTDDHITQLAQNYVKQLISLKPSAVHVMGEMNFTHKCVTILKEYDIKCIASTTVRNSTENENIKTSHFEFVQFREY
jgi:hypothetical protein